MRTVWHADADVASGGRLARCRRPSPQPTPSSSPSSNAAVSSSPGTPASPSCSPPTARSPRSSAIRRRSMLPRSSLKPLQALACLTAGAPLEGERLGLATASHSGTDRHVAVVRDILDRRGPRRGALGCPPAWPGDTATRDELVREHAAAVAHPHELLRQARRDAPHLRRRTAGTPTGYLAPEHPLQVHIREVDRAPHRREGRRDRGRRLRRARLRDDPVRARPRDPPHRQLLDHLAVRAASQRRRARAGRAREPVDDRRARARPTRS